MLDINKIKEIIPQRSPFLLIDRVDVLESGKHGIGRKCVTYNEPFFAGHFPEEPVMPGVLIIEALSQLGAVVYLSLEENKGKNAYFAGINKFKFRNKVLPGDVLTLEVSLIKNKGHIGIASAKAYDGDKVFAEGELMFAIG
ncbi:MAG: 3-hydroxyacyl-ACP dehydratase FabZ [Clostridiales bacterium]|nr:3-hydroxyacyl-ACP dehydratase FabZ [Clostridiales bacterium]